MELPEGTVAVFRTLGGATVAMVAGKPVRFMSASQEATPGFSWACLGCRDGMAASTLEDRARGYANEHAGTCRSMPMPIS